VKIVLSTKPYLIRAFYDWIMDSQGIPHMLIDTQKSGTFLPDQPEDGESIVLDISPEAVRDLVVGDEAVDFRTRFGGEIRHIVVPISAILAIYNEEGVGTFFDCSPEDIWETNAPEDSQDSARNTGLNAEASTPPSKKGFSLKRIK